MTSINKIASVLQTTQMNSIAEEPIKTISPEVLFSIILFINEIEHTRLVSHDWYDLSLRAVSNSNHYQLKQSIRLITEKLNPDKHAQCIAEFAEVQHAHRSLSGYASTFAQVRRLLLIGKGFAIGILRKQADEERNQLEIAIGKELPNSMKDLFEISKLDLKNTENIHIDTFFILLQSYEPLSINDRRSAICHAATINNLAFAKLLLAPISEDHLAEEIISSTRKMIKELSVFDTLNIQRNL